MAKLIINGVEKEYLDGTLYEEIAKEYQSQYEHRIVLVNLNGKEIELCKPCKKDGVLTFTTVRDRSGYLAYRRSVLFLMLKVADEINAEYGVEKIRVENNNNNGLYCKVISDKPVSQAYIDHIKTRMKELIDADIKIKKRNIDTDEAIRLFASLGKNDKERLFKYRQSAKTNIYDLDGFVDYYYGSMVPSTGYLKFFDMELFKGGFVIVFPRRKKPETLEPFEPYEKLFKVQEETDKWGKLMGIQSVADLNEYIIHNDIKRLILVQEALQEKKIGEIAEDIYRKGKRIVLIAGPSSSGKTTFSHRLSVQLEALGLHPHPIAVDDYFVNRDDMIPLPDNTLDFEALEAVDVKQFNEDMTKLLAGERVELPVYNFKTGRREYKDRFKQLGDKDILVVEGIHCLNEKMSYALPKESKYKIYISALTALNVDEHNRISTTDARLLRRMIRDARTRGTSPKGTLERWASVRRGEDKNIFPYQEDADAMFNSVLIYELAVLKPYAQQLLYSVPIDAPEYQRAKSMLKFLDFFVATSAEGVPKNSILSEFIGGGCFDI